jgi:hypothetical protein
MWRGVRRDRAREFGLAGFQPLMRPIGPSDDDDDIDNWMAQRNAGLAARDDAEAAGRDAWDQATWSGEELDAPQPSDLVRLGAQALSAGVAVDDDGANSAPDESTSSWSDLDAPVERAQPIEPDGPLLTPPRFGFATAQSGDSISKLAGTSDPAAIGRFLSLNGMSGRASTIYAGQSYAVPTQFDDAIPDEIAAGGQTLQKDNARLAVAGVQRAPAQADDDLWSRRLDARLNVWTGEPISQPRAPQPESYPTPPRPSGNWFEKSAAAKKIAGDAAQFVGEGYGVLRGVAHAAQGVIDGYDFLTRLGSPLDPYLSPPGESARDDAARLGQQWKDYVSSRATHPGLFARDVGDWLHSEDIKLNPAATPVADTTSDEVVRKFGIGANRGGAAVDIGTVLFGGDVAKGLEALAVAREAPAVEALVRANLEPKLADYMLEPDNGMGSHFIPRRTRLPKALGGARLPSSLVDSRFNVSKLSGATRWQQQKYHFENDPSFYGGRVRGRSGKGSGWSGERDFGWQRNDPITRLIAGMPADTKGTLGGAAVAGLNSTMTGGAEDQLP